MKRLALASLLSLFALSGQAQITVSDPWVRGTVAQQKATGAFMNLKADSDYRLVAAKSPTAGLVEIHEMSMEKDVMRMRALPNGLELPAGKNVELMPGGYHVMLMELKQQLSAGDTVPITLVVESKDKKRSLIEISAPVRALGKH